MTSLSTSQTSQDAAIAERIGTVIGGQWKLESVCGLGAMAAVYQARNSDDELVAVKILHANFAHDQEACELLLREAEVTKKVTHPGAITMLESGTTERGETFLVMELLQGDTILDLWRKANRQLALIPALQISERIVDCLIAAHRVGLVHRDLKPANVFLTHEQEVKLLDFGVALLLDDGVESRRAAGTPAYMSPEQALGRVLDGRTDLFSVGAMLHVLITGHRINAGKTEAESLVLAASRPAASVRTLAPNLPSEVVKVIDRSLAWDRQSRFDDAAQMQQALLEALAAVGGEPLAEPGGARTKVRFDLSGAPTRQPTTGDRHNSAVRNTRLRTFFAHIERALSRLERYGHDHPSVLDAARHAMNVLEPEEASEADTGALRVEVLPYGFAVLGSLVWEPTRSDIPYRLFESGVRTLTFHQGLTAEELRELISLVSRKEGQDLPPDDDLRSALWERGLPHIEVASAAELSVGPIIDRQRFATEVAEVQRSITDPVLTIADAIDAGDRLAVPKLAFDAELRSSASSQLGLGIEEWTLRYLDAALFGYVEAQTEQERETVKSSLHSSARGLLWSGRLVTVIGVYHGLSVRLNQLLGDQSPETRAKLRGLAESLFGGENLPMVVRLAGSSPATGKLLELPLALLGTSLEVEIAKLEPEAPIETSIVSLLPPPPEDAG